MRPPAQGVRRAVATRVPAPVAEDSVEEVPDSEEEELILESDGSGSEYEVSGSENEPNGVNSDDSGDDYAEPVVVDEYAEQDGDDEAVMVDAAIQASLETARLDSSRNGDMSSAGAGSSKQRTSINPAAALRAAAAERRLAQERDDSVSVVEALSGSEESPSEDEPPLAKGKGKAKVSAAMLNLVDTREAKVMTAAERRRQRQLRRMEQSGVKVEEKKLRLKLGRKLTHVGPSSHYRCQPLTVIVQAERSTIALQLYHPELKDVWGDLERTIPIVKPKKLEPPASLKVTLLPFQEESLYWMKEQEKGPWKGGMLAVSINHQ